MAFLEKRGDRYRVIFRHAGRRYAHNLKTTKASIAEGLKGGIEKTLMLLDQKVIKVPDGVDSLSFIVSNGQVEPQAVEPGTPNGKPRNDVTLRELELEFVKAHPVGSMEQNSLDAVAIHFRHFVRTFGANFPMQTLTLAKLQDHVNRRAKKKGLAGVKTCAW